MKYWLLVGIIGLLNACSNKTINLPEGVGMNLQLATVGAGRFEDYIHSLDIYAFKLTAGGEYIYDKTLARLDSAEIVALADGSAKGDTKLLPVQVAVGTYEFYFVGNGSGHYQGEFIEGRTTPEQVRLTGNAGGEDNVIFLGKRKASVVTSYMPPLQVTLDRIVSKLVLVLYEVPVQVDSVSVILGNLAASVDLTGQSGGEATKRTESFSVRKSGSDAKDTIVGEMITLPSLAGGASFQLAFFAENGQKKVKEMPGQVLLPDKYVRVVGIINDALGAFLSFEVNVKLFLFDYWLDQKLPDFVINKK